MLQPSPSPQPTLLQQLGQRRAVVITLVVAVVLIGGVFAFAQGSPNTSPSGLSDAPVTACASAQGGYYPFAPGVLTATVQGHPVTHFYSGQPFQLVYTGDTGDSYAPQQVGVDAYPNFDGATHAEDADSAYLNVTAQNIRGTTLTVPVTFPFLAPKFPNPYTKVGSYCFTLTFAYTRPDGAQVMVTAYIGLYEEPVNAAQSQQPQQSW